MSFSWEEFIAFNRPQYIKGLWGAGTEYEALYCVHEYGHYRGWFVFKDDRFSPTEYQIEPVLLKFKFYTSEAGNGLLAEIRARKLYDVIVAALEAAKCR